MTACGKAAPAGPESSEKTEPVVTDEPATQTEPAPATSEEPTPVSSEEPAPDTSEEPQPKVIENATVSALKFKTAPTIDGVITEAEWGTPTVTSPEPDGQYCPSGRGNNWNGDTIQVRIDPNGANSTGTPAHPFADNVINACFAMITYDGSMSSFDHSSVINGDMENALFRYALSDGVSSWEIAIPHSDICKEYPDSLNLIKEGFEYGITVVRLNAEPSLYYNTWLSWGSGVCGPQPDELCPGSNNMVLSGEYATE